VTARDLIPDGIRIVVDWDSMDIGDSVFVPCLNIEKGRHEVRRVAALLGIELTTRFRIENAIWGLRVWRTA